MKTKCKIGDLGQVVTGKTPSTSKREYYGHEYPFITPSDITGSFHVTPATYLSSEGARLLNKIMIPAKSVCYTCIASIGKICVTKEDSFTNQQINSIIVDEEKNDFRYVYYLLKFYTNHIKAIATGAATPIVNKERFSNVEVSVHKLDKQKRIADILSAYDDLIENNQKQIKLLEEAAMWLYKEWFVKLRFPGHEKTKIEDGVPEGWEKCNLGLYAKVKSGYAFKSSWWKHNGVPVIKIKDIQDNTVNLSQLDCVDISNANKAIDFKVVAGDLLIAMTGATTGKIAIVPIADDMLVNQRVGKFFLGENPIAKLPFLYSTLQEANSHNWALNFANGSAQPNISPTQIESLEILFSERFVSLYNEKMQPYFESIIKLRRLINRAQQARDKLLPKLMSGEIEV
jgi:type I restriction enzyme S subunit